MPGFGIEKVFAYHINPDAHRDITRSCGVQVKDTGRMGCGAKTVP